MAVLVILIGSSSLFWAWALPLVSDHMPHRAQIALLAVGTALILGGGLLCLRAVTRRPSTIERTHWDAPAQIHSTT